MPVFNIGYILAVTVDDADDIKLLATVDSDSLADLYFDLENLYDIPSLKMFTDMRAALLMISLSEEISSFPQVGQFCSLLAK